MDRLAENIIKRYTPEEKEAILDALLEEARPKIEQEVQLVTAYEYMDQAKQLMEQGQKIVGLTSGYSEIDAFTRGFSGGDMVVWFGGTSQGKSQIVQNITWRLAKLNIPVLFMGLEMTRAQNTRRFMGIADAFGDDYSPLATILYPQSNDVKLETIEANIKKGVEDGARLVVIDQLQQLTRSVTNRTNETSMITAEIKRMAIKYNVPIFLLAHINRSGDPGSPPSLQELKDSSSIEQDADVCIAVWRDMDPRHNALDHMEVVCRKNRNHGHVGESTTLVVTGDVGLKQILD